jgi:hypothetical protein
MEAEGLIPAKDRCAWRVVVGEPYPNPQDVERVVLKSHVERGFSFPPSEFFYEVLSHYGLQPHNLPTNSILVVSIFVALCEGYLEINSRLDLFNCYYQIKKQSVVAHGPLANCVSISFKIRNNREYPELAGHKSVKL